MLPCCLVPDLLPRTWITPLVKPSGYCSPIEDHARLFEYSPALPSIYLFASCLTLPVFLTMPLNKGLHMDPHASCLVDPVTEYSATQGSSSFSKEPWPGMDPFDQLLDLRQGSSSIEEYVTQFCEITYKVPFDEVMLK